MAKQGRIIARELECLAGSCDNSNGYPNLEEIEDGIPCWRFSIPGGLSWNLSTQKHRVLRSILFMTLFLLSVVILGTIILTFIYIHHTQERLEFLETKIEELMDHKEDVQVPLGTHLLQSSSQVRRDLTTLQNDMITQQTMYNFLETLYSNIQKVQKELEQNPVPIGFIYIQLSAQPEPSALWVKCVKCKWEEVSSKYAGLFFRVLGGNSGHFGETQEENVPRITKVETQAISYWPGGSILLPVGGTSPFLYSGITVNPGSIEATRYTTSGGEVRPINQAVRLWKRIV